MSAEPRLSVLSGRHFYFLWCVTTAFHFLKKKDCAMRNLGSLFSGKKKRRSRDDFNRARRLLMEVAEERLAMTATVLDPVIQSDAVFLSHQEPMFQKNFNGGVVENAQYFAPIIVNGQRVDIGLGMHAPRVGVGEAGYRIPDGFDRFRAVVDLGAGRSGREPTDSGNASLRVLLDGGLVFEASQITFDSPPLPIDLDISGKSELVFQVSPNGVFYSDHVVLLHPRWERTNVSAEDNGSAVSSDWLFSVETEPGLAHVGERMIVQLTENAIEWIDTPESIANFIPGVRSGLGAKGSVLVEVDDAGQSFLRDLQQSGFVEMFETDFEVETMRSVADVVDDPLAGELYGHDRIHAADAWEVSTGENALVAVIDTGVNLNHPDLRSSWFVNSGEIVGNNIDDDGDGIIDNPIGASFVGGRASGDVSGNASHAPHVIGTIAAAANGEGIVGIAKNAKIYPVKIFPDGGGARASVVVAAVNHIVNLVENHDVPIRVINASFGGGGHSLSMEAAFRRAAEFEIVVTAAAGNSGSDRDHFPSGYDLPNIISVAAVDESDRLASFSNFHPTNVDVAAPGVGILSAGSGDQWIRLDGTSMAAPHVAGQAALIVSQFPNLSAAQVVERILSNVDEVASLAGKVASGGIVNAARSLGRTPDPEPPKRPAIGYEVRFDRLILQGTSGDDEVRIFRDGASIVVQANDDQLRFDSGLVTRVFFRAGDGADRFVNHSDLRSVAYLGRGNDHAVGGSGRDFFFGQIGADILDGRGGRDRLIGGGGPDTLIGGPGPDYLDGQRGRDKIFARIGDRVIADDRDEVFWRR